MRIRLLCLLVVACLGTPAFAGDGTPTEEPAGNPVEQALLAPPATGLLVKFVGAGSQAQAKGVLPGDVIISYADKAVATLDALTKAKAGITVEKTAVPCVLQRGAKRITVEFSAGPLGVTLAPVEKGKPAAPLPKATIKTLDLSKLALTPREVWFRFLIDGKQLGFEHGVLRRTLGVLTLRHEVGFDGGKAWGMNHQEVLLVADAESGCEVQKTRYTNLLNGWRGDGRRRRPAQGAPFWEVRWPPSDGQALTRRVALPTDLPILPSYLVSAVVEHLPQEKGACLHYRPLNEGMGTVGLASALYVVGEEALEHDGAQVATWKIELRELGGTSSSTWWVSGDGEVLRIDYRGAQAHRSTKEQVLAGLPEGLRPGGPPAKR